MDKANRDEPTPLLVAAFNGHTEVVAQLLAAGAVVNQADQYGRTAFYEAAENGRTEIAQLLIDKQEQM